MANLVWTQDGQQQTDTIHRAGCAHTRMTTTVNTLSSNNVDDAKMEIAYAMGWVDYPQDNDGVGFVLAVAPCAQSFAPA